jgi:hypothetical protein
MVLCRMLGVLTIAPIPEEHRLHRRYPIRLKVHYKLLHHGIVTETGSGQTRNIGTCGVLFETDRPLPGRGDRAGDGMAGPVGRSATLKASCAWTHRSKRRESDFFKSAPTGADAYILRWVPLPKITNTVSGARVV